MPQSHSTPQHMFRCVQCDSFVERSSDAQCPSHNAESHTPSDTGLVWSPCSSIGCTGCVSQPHSQTAHADYPYSSFYASVNTLLDTQKTFTVVSAETSLAVFGLTDSSHAQPNHLFLYVTPAGRDHPLQRLLFFSPDQLAFVALRASMSVMYQDTSKENILTALTDERTKNSVEATWIANSIGGIIGIQISCKAVPMSSEPAVTNVYISQDEALQFGLFGVNVLSTYDAAPSPAHAKSNLKHLRRIGDAPIRSGLPRTPPAAAMAEFHVLACVQCGADFIESENFSYSCRYHKLEAGKCCLKGNIACASSAHRSEHHTEYPYAAYDSYLKEFFRFDHEMFGSVQSQDVSYEPVVPCSISVGVTLASHVTAPNQFFVFYKCGAESNSQHLMLYSKDELMDSALDVEPVIAKYEDSGSFVEALWIIENGNIIGVQMHAKSATMQTPSISRVLFDFDHSKVPNLTTVSILSESHFGEYALPKSLRNDAYKSLPASSKTFLHHDADALILGIPRPRPPEKFQAIAMKACPLKISFVSVDCFRSNKALGGDQFLIVADIINVSNEPIQIHEFNCWWKSRDGDSEWSLAKISEDSMSRSFDGWSQINGNKWATLKLFIDVGQAGVARLGSLLFDVELVCVGGSSVSLTMEHTADQVYQIPDGETDQLNYIILESPVQHTTLNVEVNRKPRLDLLTVSVLGHVHKITLEAARRAVIIAERNPDLGGLVQIVSDCRDEYMCVLKVYGLVDVGCRRVYAVRVDVNFEGASAVRYFPIDEYGDALALDPVVGKSVIESSCALLGLEGYEPTEGIVFREQELLEFAPRVIPPIGVAGSIIEKPAPPVASVDTIEQAVLNLLESRLAEFVAKVSPAPPTITVNGVSGVDEKLDLILAKLGAMDARMTVIETQQEVQAKHVSNQLVAVVARVENSATANSVKDRALQKTLEDVRVALTARQTTFEELVALDSLAERLESVGIDADELTSASTTIQDSELSALDALAKRLESIGAHADELTSSVHDMVRSATPEAISAVDAKLEKVAASLEVWDARMDKMESLTVLPDLILKSLEQIEQRHAEFDNHAFSRQNVDVTHDPSQRQREFGAKLNELRQSVEMLPQAYKAALEISLEKQTDYILASIEGRPVRIVEEGRPTSPPATPPAAERSGGGNNGLKSNRLSQIRMSIPAVPNMGIASGISKLSGMVGRQGATPNPDSPNAVTENVTLLSDPQ